ncbi:MAG: signal peptidase I [Chloroflexota bacterium]
MKALRSLANVLSAGLTLVAVLLLVGLTAVPAALGYKTYVVLSGSMEPAIKTGAVIFAQAVAPTSLKVGDVIVYNRTDIEERVTHRIVEMNDVSSGKPTFVTKGDANGAPDAWTVQYSGNTAGKVLFSIPYVGYVNHALETPQGRMLFVIVPVLVLSIMWLLQIWKPNKAGEQQPSAIPEAAPAKAVAASAPPDFKAGARDKSEPLPLRQ